MKTFDLLKRVCIIIVTWKRDDLLEDCLNSLVSIYGALPDMVIVDNANQSSTAELVARYDGVKYIAATDNLGFAGGNNLGMKYCTKEFVFLLNNDTIFREDSISPLVEFMDQHPKAAVLQGRAVYAEDPSLVDGCGMFFSSIGTMIYPGFLMKVGGEYDMTRAMPAAGGPCCLFRCLALADVGGELYHDFFWAYFEDVDLSLRAWRSGHEVWYVSSPPILHRRSLTAKMFPSEKILNHLYFNMAASYWTVFSYYGRLRFFLIRHTCYFLKALALLCCMKPSYMRIQAHVLTRLWKERKTIHQLSLRLSKMRTLSDRALLKKFESLRAPTGVLGDF